MVANLRRLEPANLQDRSEEGLLDPSDLAPSPQGPSAFEVDNLDQVVLLEAWSLEVVDMVQGYGGRGWMEICGWKYPVLRHS